MPASKAPSELQKIRERGQKKLNWNNLPKSGVVLITGFRGEGKTALAWWMADMLRNNQGFPSRVVPFGLTEAAVKLLPKWAQHPVTDAEELFQLKPSIIIVDEAAFSANARRSMSEDNVNFMKLFAITRHKGHLLIFISQTSRQVDVQIIEQADLMLMKKPSALQVKMARRELKDQTEEAFTLLNGKVDSRKWVYAYDPQTDAAKVLSASMPTWWTKKLSHLYSEVTI
jgi:SpoVK/Ycf46/Vps4 family AAA+-type ATPase